MAVAEASTRPEKDPAKEDLPTDGSPQPGVLVFVRETAQGPKVDIECLGGYDPMAAPSLLELGYKVARLKLGLDV